MNRIMVGFIFVFSCLIVLGKFYYGNEISLEISKYPDGKDFAFTITDDPDYGWMEEKLAIYGLLDNLGFRTTIPVWVLNNKHGTGEDGVNSGVGGITTVDSEYLSYTKELQNKGFEIALHTVSPGNDLREETIIGYDLFEQQFGGFPKVNINHSNNLDNIYWGSDRFSNKILRLIYSLFTTEFQGDKQKSGYFWGDIAKEKTKYVRGWATDNIDTLSINKSMPYHLADKPYVNYWFGCSDGYNYNKFIKLISDDNINQLIANRGTAIVYTHFGYGFVDKTTNLLRKDVTGQLTRLSQRDGWFVPVSTILDRFLLLRNIEVIRDESDITIINHNDKPVKGLTVLTDQEKLYFSNKNKWQASNKNGEIILGDFAPYSVFKLRRSEQVQKNESPGMLESINMVLNWFVGRFD